MKLALIAGARPQFIKAAALLPALRDVAETRFIHTGQHYDDAMVAAHFPALDLPEPDVILAGVDDDIAPALDGVDRVVVMGDTDSTLMGARGAHALGLAVAHVEAGARSGEADLPEEAIRIEVDALSDLLFCSTEAHAANLAGREGVHVTGDVMADVLLARRADFEAPPAMAGDYVVLTMHRAGAADDPAVVGGVLEAAASAGMPIVFPKHPRTRLDDVPAAVDVVDPMPYASFLGLVEGARVVLTDSGGLQKEAYMLGVPCLTLREATEWGETIDAGWNALVGTDPDRIRAALADPPRAPDRPALYGEGDASLRIAALCAAAR